MLTRSEYDRIIELFLVELNHLCLNSTDKDLHSLPTLSCQLDNYLIDLRDPASSAAQSLYRAFAFLDEYCGANWKQVASAGYEAYKIDQSKSGEQKLDSN